MGHKDDTRVEPALASLLTSKDEALVEAPVRALSRRAAVSTSVIQQVGKLALAEHTLLVRREAAQALATWKKLHPDLEPTLRRIAETDESPQVREVASRALAR